MEYDKSKYKLKNWKSPTNLHWILNPGLAFNEIVLGQRIPKRMLIDKKSNKPLMERSYVPCPHCETMHDGRTWSPQNGTAFKNWFGYYCPECGGIIPCLYNGLSYLLILLTYPLWGWAKDNLKNRWLAYQADRFDDSATLFVNHKDVSWAKIGAQWGAVMFLMFCSIGIALNPSNYLYIAAVNLMVWGIAGLSFALGSKYWMGLKGENS